MYALHQRCDLTSRLSSCCGHHASIGACCERPFKQCLRESGHSLHQGLLNHSSCTLSTLTGYPLVGMPGEGGQGNVARLERLVYELEQVGPWVRVTQDITEQAVVSILSSV